MKLINKAAIVAEIEKCYNECLKRVKIARIIDSNYWNTKAEAYRNVLVILDNTLEVKEAENTELLKVRGYLVRDKDDYTAIYAEKPHRGKTEWVDGNDSCLMTINDARLVPDIEFEDEPVEVEVTLKRLNARG